MKTIDTQEYVSALKEAVENGQEAGMLVWGNSMAPFLVHKRDKIFFSAPKRPLKRGDMVFYQRPDGQYVMHRICKVTKEGYFIAGDAQTILEGPVRREQIFAIITHVERKGKALYPGAFWWNFFAGPWVRLLRFRSIILRLLT